MKEQKDRVEENSHKGGEKRQWIEKQGKKILRNQNTASGYPTPE